MENVSVATTRRTLQIIRKACNNSTPGAPFNPSATLEEAELPGTCFDHFAFRFVQSHALKRRQKSTMNKT